ncbi:T9SS type A sorting domain-containing protein [Falsiporphyromonas endometrii]|uniref:T9SS type A sorting domain-containing protein n=1 Tax=Falsiporphyromonas endometrii TaxID=1387297 RepID=A0ABV9K7T6_9PORP
MRINHASPYSDHRGNINISVDSDKVGIQSQSPISRAMIFDMTGKLVVMQDGDSHTLTMNLPLNSSGEYIVKVQLADGTGTIKKLLKR